MKVRLLILMLFIFLILSERDIIAGELNLDAGSSISVMSKDSSMSLFPGVYASTLKGEGWYETSFYTKVPSILERSSFNQDQEKIYFIRKEDCEIVWLNDEEALFATDNSSYSFDEERQVVVIKPSIEIDTQEDGYLKKYLMANDPVKNQYVVVIVAAGNSGGSEALNDSDGKSGQSASGYSQQARGKHSTAHTGGYARSTSVRGASSLAGASGGDDPDDNGDAEENRRLAATADFTAEEVMTMSDDALYQLAGRIENGHQVDVFLGYLSKRCTSTDQSLKLSGHKISKIKSIIKNRGVWISNEAEKLFDNCLRSNSK